jgi:hypothetical protein
MGRSLYPDMGTDDFHNFIVSPKERPFRPDKRQSNPLAFSFASPPDHLIQ